MSQKQFVQDSQMANTCFPCVLRDPRFPIDLCRCIGLMTALDRAESIGGWATGAATGDCSSASAHGGSRRVNKNVNK